ncbi:NAD(P)H-dependent FMN reductase [Dyella sp. OK004]|uniref:NADPH-dependent FMN reductase n=1 Tax=Dyella sp. OK004 TaxID=1855292 RepID=UPI0008E368D0|nr:NADPH-dependent FMN reductase [Dyella sp. OK004]SFS03341.1 NAD(P)H-dependent FMN reductase [Dyella sp. OK004]
MTAGARFRVLCLSGSLRGVSGNTALLRAARTLAPIELELSLYESMGALPLFNPDLDVEPLPETVIALRRAIGASDALIVACPEYAHGIPGPFKNLLDWLVGSLEFPGKPVAQWNASGRGSHHAQAALREVLQTMSAQVLDSATAEVPLPGAGCTVESLLEQAEQTARIGDALGRLLQALHELAALEAGRV